MIQTINEEEEEQPEKFGITGTAVSHLIEFAPDSGVIWIVDDDSEATNFTCTLYVLAAKRERK